MNVLLLESLRLEQLLLHVCCKKAMAVGCVSGGVGGGYGGGCGTMSWIDV